MKLLIIPLLLTATLATAETFTPKQIAKQIEQGERLSQTLDLADVMFCEASGEKDLGMLAVADVVLNRVADKRFPNTLAGVIYQRHQFECIQNGKKGNLDDADYLNAMKLARRVLDGKTPRITKANHYYATYIDTPYWADDKKKLGQIGHHIFYKL